MPGFRRLRGFGPIGSVIATALTFMTTNWALVVSVVGGIVAGAINWLRSFVLNPEIEAATGTFLAVLWTVIGITVLIDRRRPTSVTPHADYRYGLTFDGLQPRYMPPSHTTPDAGSLHFALLVHNFNQGPIKFEIEELDIRLRTRAVPRLLPGTVYGFLARGAARTSTIKGFTKEELKEFYSDSGDPAKGTIDMSYVYGHPDEPPQRRLKIRVDFYVVLVGNGEMLGWQDAIISERDESLIHEQLRDSL